MSRLVLVTLALAIPTTSFAKRGKAEAPAAPAFDADLDMEPDFDMPDEPMLVDEADTDSFDVPEFDGEFGDFEADPEESFDIPAFDAPANSEPVDAFDDEPDFDMEGGDLGLAEDPELEVELTAVKRDKKAAIPSAHATFDVSFFDEEDEEL